ncbi:hypothetical protein [Sphingomonas elodea]|uniref:hypothetical protein n=1 Tax=Sphingomonas elodea TaxID=179878 RepID=UPI00026321CC|nr:hypothetical protein [Sphingomonas elodea]
MTLDDYLATEGAPTLTELSARIGVSKGRLSQLRKSSEWPAQLALDAERATDGALVAAQLCPLIGRIRGEAA